MPVIKITNNSTGEVGFQARAEWQSPPGSTKYFSCKRYGKRKAKRLAQEAELVLMLQYRVATQPRR